MIWRLTWELALFLVVLLVLLFWPAGTFDWWGGWAYVVQMMVGGTAICTWLYIHDPALLKERLSSGFEKKQLFWDKVLMAMVQVGFFAWLVLMAFDRRWGVSPFPTASQRLVAVEGHVGQRHAPPLHENSPAHAGATAAKHASAALGESVL